MSFWKKLFGVKRRAMDQTVGSPAEGVDRSAGANRIPRLVAEINRRVYESISASNRASSGHAEMYMHWFASFGYGSGTVLYKGDFEILQKAFDFSTTCIKNDWVASRGEGVDPDMTVSNPDKG